MILVKASAGLVIEFGLSESGQWNSLSVRLSGLSPEPFRFEAQASPEGPLLVRPLEARPPAQLLEALGAVVANEDAILAEVRKYNRPRR